MGKFLKTQNLPRLKHEERENLKRTMTGKEIESVIKNLPTKESPGPESFTGEFYQTCKELIPILLKLLQKTVEEGMLPISFYEASITLTPKPKTLQDNYRPISLTNIDEKSSSTGK